MTEIVHLMLVIAALMIIITTRYFLFSGLAYWLLWGEGGSRLRATRLNRDRPIRSLILHEMKLSILASAIHAVPAAIALVAWWNYGGTQIYASIADYGVPYLLLSGFLYLAVQDTYYYWAHRVMHHPRLFGIMHAGHHKSRQPTPFSSFAFDPAEAVVTAWILPVLVFLVPIHIGVLVALLLIMTITAVLNHSGWEILPTGFVNGIVGGQLISATHHGLHHIRFNANYGLYFRFWDKIMGTDAMPKRPVVQKAPLTAQMPEPEKAPRLG